MEGLVQAVARPRRPLLLRVLVVLLAIMVAIAAPAHTYLEAQAVLVIDDAAVAVVAVLIVACGFVFENHEMLTKCAWDIWKRAGSDFKAYIKQMVTTLSWTKEQVVRISDQVRLWISDLISSSWSREEEGFVIDADITGTVKVSDIPEMSAADFSSNPVRSCIVEGYTYTFKIEYAPDAVSYADYWCEIFKDGKQVKGGYTGRAEYMTIEQFGFGDLIYNGATDTKRWVYLPTYHMSRRSVNGELVPYWSYGPYVLIGEYGIDDVITLGGAREVVWWRS